MSEHLEALALQADGIDAETAASSPQAIQAQAEQDQQIAVIGENVSQVQMILDLSLPLLGAMYPRLNEVYTEQARQAVAHSLGPVLSKYGISLQDWGTAYKEEIGALMVCGPIAWATVQAVKADIADRQKKEPLTAVSSGQQQPAPKETASDEPVRLG